MSSPAIPWRAALCNDDLAAGVWGIEAIPSQLSALPCRQWSHRVRGVALRVPGDASSTRAMLPFKRGSHRIGGEGPNLVCSTLHASRHTQLGWRDAPPYVTHSDPSPDCTVPPAATVNCWLTLPGVHGATTTREPGVIPTATEAQQSIGGTTTIRRSSMKVEA